MSLLLLFGLVACSWPEAYTHEQLVLDCDDPALSPSYTLNAWLPVDPPPEGDAPVLFLLDGDEGPGMREAMGVVDEARLEGLLPEGLVVVGIGYGEHRTGRERDYTPSVIEGRDSGEAQAFFSFVADQVVPAAEVEWDLGPEHALGGHSLGGLGTLWALFHHSDRFDGFISMSPSLMWDDQQMFAVEAEYASVSDDLPVRLHLCVGGEESSGQTVGWQAMVEKLESRDYPGLDLGSAVAHGHSHMGSRPHCLAAGLEHVYP